MAKKDLFLYMLLCFSFASTITSGKIALTAGVTPFVLAGGRFFIGAVLLLTVLLFYKLSVNKNKDFSFKISGKNFFKVSVLSVFMFIIPFSCIINALVFLPSGVAGIVGASIPLFTMIFSHFMFSDEKFTLYKFAGLLLSSLGLALLAVSGGKSFSPQNANTFIKGFLLYTTGCASIGLGNAFAKKLKPDISFSLSSLYQAFIAGIFFVVTALIFENPSKLKVSIETVLPVLYVAVFGMGLPYAIYYNMLSRIGPVKMSTITLIIPVLTVLFGYIILNENVNIYTFLSAVLVISGVGIILFYKKRLYKNTAA